MNKKSIKIDYDKAFSVGAKLLSSKKYYEQKTGLFILIGIQSGLRSIDILELNKSRIEQKSNGSLIHYTANKTKKEGTAFVGSIVSDAIKECNTDSLFYNEKVGTHFSHTWINRRLKQVFESDYKKAIKQNKTLSVHSLRKTAGTKLYNAFGVETARKLLQHSNYSTTVSYIEETEAEHLNKLESLFS